MKNLEDTADRKDARKIHKTIGRVLLALAITMPAIAMASDVGTDELGLEGLLEWLRNLLMGPLGKIGALTGFAIAMIGGVMRGSIMGFVVGIGMAVAFYYGPDVILRVFGATLGMPV
ncbi:TraA family conjugative transfer protein [Luteimonas sp. MHLX1A]|uniref:TraA family conjugative transfer protein n=1 Tax=Alterluteimonas muca TaxID=2878684 RepID=UPI001E4B7236|nr:TraA family conjugative transfer protein [Luteimonas sp. MHLX1A]MCD9046903.1 hypothetical protein [Luteimonas sp. MHLX1A]